MMTLRALATALLLIAPGLAFAAGGDDDTPPAPTPTTTQCPAGQIFDEDAATCIVIQDSRLDDDTLYQTARELAYHGRLQDALAVLARMSDQNDSRVHTYLGFVHRHLGNTDLSMAHYHAALAADADNLLARSYLGLAHLAADQRMLARAQLQQIRARGGAGSWPEQALNAALNTGIVADY